MRDHLGRGPDDLGIDIGPRTIARVEVEHHHPKRDADMRRGDPDAWCGVHGLQQVSRQLAQRVIEHGHGLRRERKPWVGVTDNRANGHVRDCLMPVNGVRQRGHSLRTSLHVDNSAPDGQISARRAKSCPAARAKNIPLPSSGKSLV